MASTGLTTHTGLKSPFAHAEMEALNEALQSKLARCNTGGMWGDRRILQRSVMYSTHRPCAMCGGAIELACMRAVVYGTSNADVDTCRTRYSPFKWRTNRVGLEQVLAGQADGPRIQVIGGFMLEECRPFLLCGVRDIFQLLE